MPRLTDAQLLSAISAAEADSVGGESQGEVSQNRSDAIDRYLGKEYGDEKAGRSRVVSRDVSDVVEGVVANVLKPFISGDRVVQFDPRGPEDEEQALQETDYVNFVVLERNNGFLLLTACVKDALLLRNCYAKCAWTTRQDVMVEPYRGLSGEEAAMLLQDPDVEVVGQEEIMGALGPMYNLTLRRKRPTEYVEVLPVAPDEVRITKSLTSPCLQDADFVQHKTKLSISKVRELGYKVPDDISDDDSGETQEDFARDRDVTANDDDDATDDPARRIVEYKETWIRIDRDGDGIAELRRVCSIGLNLLHDEETDVIGMAGGTAVLMPHQHLGVSVYDLVEDVAKLKTALLRQFMDNKYLANNSRVLVDVTRVHTPDLAVSRPGGIVRVKTGDPSTAVVPLVAPDTGASALQALEYLDSVRENRTGYTRYAQGMDSDSLVNKTATGLMQVTSQSQMRLEMMARTVAETFLRDLFLVVHAMTLKHSTKEEKVRLRNKWVPINPREWTKRSDLSISMGLGSGTPEQTLMKLQGMAQLMPQLMGLGLAGPQEVHAMATEMWKAAGFKHADKFLKEPQIDPQTGQPQMPPPQKDPLVQAEEVKVQGTLQKAQIDAQTAAAKAQQDMQAAITKAQIDADNDYRKCELQEQNKYRIAMAEVGKDLLIAGNQAQLEEQQQALEVSRMAVENERAQVAQEHEAVKGNQEFVGKHVGDLVTALHEAVKEMQAPMEVEVVRDKNGRAVGARRRKAA